MADTETGVGTAPVTLGHDGGVDTGVDGEHGCDCDGGDDGGGDVDGGCGACCRDRR